MEHTKYNQLCLKLDCNFSFCVGFVKGIKTLFKDTRKVTAKHEIIEEKF